MQGPTKDRDCLRIRRLKRRSWPRHSFSARKPCFSARKPCFLGVREKVNSISRTQRALLARRSRSAYHKPRSLLGDMEEHPWSEHAPLDGFSRWKVPAKSCRSIDGRVLADVTGLTVSGPTGLPRCSGHFSDRALNVERLSDEPFKMRESVSR